MFIPICGALWCTSIHRLTKQRIKYQKTPFWKPREPCHFKSSFKNIVATEILAGMKPSIRITPLNMKCIGTTWSKFLSVTCKICIKYLAFFGITLHFRISFNEDRFLSLSFVFTCCITRRHLLSFIATRCNTSCHFLSLHVSFFF